MLVQEISSFFIFSIIVGLAFVSNFFLHRLDVTPRTVSEGVRISVFILNLLLSQAVFYLIRRTIPAYLSPNELIET